jgi:hypothetical protein
MSSEWRFDRRTFFVMGAALAVEACGGQVESIWTQRAAQYERSIKNPSGGTPVQVMRADVIIGDVERRLSLEYGKSNVVYKDAIEKVTFPLVTVGSSRDGQRLEEYLAYFDPRLGRLVYVPNPPGNRYTSIEPHPSVYNDPRRNAVTTSFTFPHEGNRTTPILTCRIQDSDQLITVARAKTINDQIV